MTVALERPEPARELVVGLPQCGLRLDAELARKIGDGKQQVAHFLLRARRGPARPARDDLAQFVHLFLNLLDHIVGPGPVEAD